MYATQANIEAEFGENNVAKWSNLDNDTEGADAERITWALEYADNAINSRFRGSRYAVPLVDADNGGVPGIVQNWAAKLAGVQLYQCRGLNDDDETGNKLTAIRDAVHREISAALADVLDINAYQADSMPTGPVVCL